MELEKVTYKPTDPETYPSVCHTPNEVEERFGFTGGETLLFDEAGNYVGQLVKELVEGDEVQVVKELHSDNS